MASAPRQHWPTSSAAGAATSHGSSCSWAINARSFRIRTTSFMTACKFTVWPLVNIWSPRRLTGRYLRGSHGISDCIVWGKGRVFQPLPRPYYKQPKPHHTQKTTNIPTTFRTEERKILPLPTTWKQNCRSSSQCPSSFRLSQMSLFSYSICLSQVK